MQQMINNLLYLIHTTPIIDHLGLAEIATETQKERTLQKITKLINKGKQWIPKTADPQVRKFEHTTRNNNHTKQNPFQR